MRRSFRRSAQGPIIRPRPMEASDLLALVRRLCEIIASIGRGRMIGPWAKRRKDRRTPESASRFLYSNQTFAITSLSPYRPKVLRQDSVYR